MTLPEVLLGVMFVGLIAYALFGGADFGAGIWDLLAGGTRRGARQREPDRALDRPGVGGQPRLADLRARRAVDGVLHRLRRGRDHALHAADARGVRHDRARGGVRVPQERQRAARCGASSAPASPLSSLATPFFLGTVVGGVASSRVPPGIATGDVVTSWLNPTSILGGVLAVLVCAYLAAVFLCLDARREGHDDLADQFRTRALGTAATTGAVGPGRASSCCAPTRPLLFDGLVGRALPVIVVSVLAGVASIVLLLVRRYGVARITSSVAVATILIGWAVGPVPVPAAALPDDRGGGAAAGRRWWR